MRITVNSKILIEDASPEIWMYCKQQLTLANPDYAKKERMGLWLGNTPKHIQLFERNGEHLILPYGCLHDVLQMADTDTEINSDFHAPHFINCRGKVNLYDYQQTAVDRMETAAGGILESPAGSGKTQMAIALIARIGLKTLWITHTKDLLQQSRERFEGYFGHNLAGSITEGAVDIGTGITFATVQTMVHLDLDRYRNEWDVIVVDECHRVSGSPTTVTMFSKVLNSLNARYKFGLSATVHRADGLIRATHALLGKVSYTVPRAFVEDKTMMVTIQPVNTSVPLSTACLSTDGTIVHTSLINYLAAHQARNEQIADYLIESADHYNLILSDRVQHLKDLFQLLPQDLQAVSMVIDGKMTTKKAKAQRTEAIANMRSGKNHYLFATYALAKEGLDIPRLDRLYMTTPVKDYAVVTQSVGRIARTYDGKQSPICYDFVDLMAYTQKSFKRRCTHYRKCGSTIKEMI